MDQLFCFGTNSFFNVDKFSEVVESIGREKFYLEKCTMFICCSRKFSRVGNTFEILVLGCQAFMVDRLILMVENCREKNFLPSVERRQVS